MRHVKTGYDSADDRDGEARKKAQDEYQRTVLDRLDDFVRRAERDPAYRTAQVLDALFVFPGRYNSSLEHSEHGYQNFKGRSSQPVRSKLHELFGCQNGPFAEITNVSGEWLVRFYRVIRASQGSDPQKAYLYQFFILNLLQCETLQDVQNFVSFLEEFSSLSLPPPERNRFLRYQLIRLRDSLRFADMLEAFQSPQNTVARAVYNPGDLLSELDSFNQANCAGPVRMRLARLSTDSPLVRLGIPLLQRALEPYGDDATVPPQILDAILALEWRNANPQRAKTVEDEEKWYEARDLKADIGLLTAEDGKLRTAIAVFGNPKYASDEEILKNAQKMIRKIEALSEPLRSLAIQRIAEEAGHPYWQIRYLYAGLVEVAAAQTQDPAVKTKFLASVHGLLNDRSNLVASRALETVLKIARNPSDPASNLPIPFNFLPVRKPNYLLRSPDAHDIKEGIEIIDRIWNFLLPDERETLASDLLTLLDRNRDAGICLKVASVFARHERTLPDRLRTALAQRGSIPDRLIDILSQEKLSSEDEDIAGQFLQSSLPFYLGLGGDLRSRLENWAWSTLDASLPKYSTIGAMIVLMELYKRKNGANDWSAEMKSKALRTVVGLVGYASLDKTTEEQEMIQGVAFQVLSGMLSVSPPAARLKVLEGIERNVAAGQLISDGSGSYHLRQESLYLRAFATLAAGIPEWQGVDSLSLFARGLGQERYERLRTLCGQLSPRHFIVLFQTLYQTYYLDPERGGAVPPEDIDLLVSHLIDQTRSAGELQQLISFFSDFVSIPEKVRREFFAFILDDSKRTHEGKMRGRVATSTTETRTILMQPTKAKARLRQFLVEHFIKSIGIPKGEQAQVRQDIQRRVSLWERNRLLPHLSSLASFSSRTGIDAITALVRDLTSAEAVEASTRTGNQRFFNPKRYQNMAGAFSPDFIKRWANDDQDFLIPMGELSPEVILEKDPLALRKVKFRHASLQIANHLNVPGASHLEGEELTRAICQRIEDLSLSSVQGGSEWEERIKNLLTRMGRMEEISEREIEAIVQPLRQNCEIREILGSGGEILSDLQEFKRGLNAQALSGRAWLVVTSDPADFIGSGRDPVTCQDPTRKTGHNHDGQPANRASQGRFRYAKVVFAKEAKIQNGVIVFSPDAQEAARSHLEVTTETGHPDPAAKPHLLAERNYPHPGFIYAQQSGEAINHFALNDLNMNPDVQVHIEFIRQNMSRFPRPLPDGGKRVYRDTFHVV